VNSEKSAFVLTMIELRPEEQNIPPQPFADLPTTGGARVGSNLWLAKITLPQQEIARRCKDHELRAAAGAQDIWDVFPEYKGEFVVTVSRRTPRGLIQIDIPLKYAIAGDVRVGTSIQLFDQKRHKDIPYFPDAISEKIKLPNSDLGQFSFIATAEPTSSLSILNSWIFLCEDISIAGTEGEEILPGVRFLTPTALFNRTHFVREVNSRNDRSDLLPDFMTFMSGPKVPEKISGAFIVSLDRTNGNYATVIINRILAAASLSGTPCGKISCVMWLEANRWQQQLMGDYVARNYADRSSEKVTIRSDAASFSEILALLKESSPQKFLVAKEDFRLLALDTVEDSRRSGITVLEFAQIWMAIERLLPFRAETTSQLALTLCAFVPASERVEQFKFLKKSYGLRSQIVHGYNFKQNEPVGIFLRDIATLFRRIFAVALTVRTSDDLRNLLIGHVLSGKPNAID
jgi:hypothetical protein